MNDLQLTAQLRRWEAGDRIAEAAVLHALFPVLHSIATRRLRRFAAAELCPAEVISETYLRLRQIEIKWQGGEHFLCTASRLMRNVIIDHERAHRCEKRGGGTPHIALESALDLCHPARPEGDADWSVLCQKVQELHGLDARHGRVAELKILSEFTTEEIARTLGMSRASVVRAWRGAREWLAANVLHPDQSAAFT